MLPSAAKLADVAELSSRRQDWETALSAAQDAAAMDTQAAADLVEKTIQAMQRCGSHFSVLVPAMSLLHAADRHESVVKVI